MTIKLTKSEVEKIVAEMCKAEYTSAIVFDGVRELKELRDNTSVLKEEGALDIINEALRKFSYADLD